MTPSLIPLRSAISLIVVPFMSPVSENARLAAARIELFLASAVSRRRRGAASPSPAGPDPEAPLTERVADAERLADAERVAGLVTRSPRFRTSVGEYVPTFIVAGGRAQRPDQAR